MCQISSIVAASEGPVAEFSSFENFERKRKSNLLMSFPKKKYIKRVLLAKKEKIRYFASAADSRYFRTYPLNDSEMIILIQ